MDDLIGIGNQVCLDGMKAELDKLMKASRSIPAVYTPGMESLRFLGCVIERMPDAQLIMHQRSYIEHCIRENGVELMRSLITLPNVDEKSPPEEPYDDDDGHPTKFENSKSTCQKYIGQLMWLAKARGSSNIRSAWNCNVSVGVGWRHHGLLSVRCVLRIVCIFLVAFMYDMTTFKKPYFYRFFWSFPFFSFFCFYFSNIKKNKKCKFLFENLIFDNPKFCKNAILTHCDTICASKNAKNTL